MMSRFLWDRDTEEQADRIIEKLDAPVVALAPVARKAGPLHYSGQANEIAERLEAGEAAAEAARLSARTAIQQRIATATTRQDWAEAVAALARLGG